MEIKRRYEPNDRDGLLARRRRIVRRLEDFRREKQRGEMSKEQRTLRDAVARIDRKLRRLKNVPTKS